jgi:hypothetical protein
MWNHRRRTVEWMWRGGETVVVFLAMSWGLFWAATRWRRPILPSRHLRRGAQFGGVLFVPTGAGHWLDSDDPDGGAVAERSRRRRRID